MKTRISLLGGLAVALLAASLPRATAQQQPKSSPARPGRETTAAGPGAAEPNGAVPEKTAPSPVAADKSSPKAQRLPPGAYVSPWLMDVIKLAQARIDETIVLSFLYSAGTFNLDPDQIIYLRDLVISSEIITAMLQHDFEIVSGMRPVPAAPSASQPTVHLAFVRSDSTRPSATSATVAPAPSSTSTARPIPGANGLLPGIREERRGADSYEPNVAIADELDTAAPGALREQSQLLPLRETISPVRKPYAVQLVDPIIMIRAAERAPNLVVIELMP